MSPLLDLVTHFEGFHRVVKNTDPVLAGPYLCPAGYWTIGYGHLCPKDHPEIDHSKALGYLDLDLAVARGGVCRYIVWTALSQNQVDALTSFVFNLGVGRFRASTLRAVIARGELDRVPDEFRKWVWAGGRKLKGLVERREAEIQLWLS